MTGGGTAGQEKVAVQGVDVTTGAEAALAQNTGSTVVTITDYLIKDASGNIVESGTVAVGTLPVGGDLTPITITLVNADPGLSYTVTLVSSKGGSFVSSSFIAP